MTCNCRSDNRTIALIAKNPVERYPELSRFGAANGWQLCAEGDIFLIEVGYAKQFKGIADLATFTRSVLDTERYQALRACFVDGATPLYEQMNVLLHAEPIDSVGREDSSVLSEILNSKSIETWYQPVVDRSGDIWGYECLMRGRASNSDVIYPNQMLEWARQEKLTFMLDRLCREMHVKNASQAGLKQGRHIFINFLPTAIYQPQFCLQSTLAAVQESGLTPSQLIFEVVETEKVADRDHLKNILSFYREAGFKVALDDVGSGYAGLSMFGDLKPDLIKIDRELVQKSAESDFHKGICAALISLSQQNGQLVLAEGVETEREEDVMKSLGVDLFQGYFFAKPSPRLVQELRAQQPSSEHA